MASRLAAVEARPDTIGFDALMLAEQRRIFMLCRRILVDLDEADTATQDVFLKAFRALEKGDSGVIENASGWLTRIAVNTCLDRLRSRRWQFWRRRVQALEHADVFQTVKSGHPDAEREMFSGQIRVRLEQALTRLTARQRVIFVMKHYEDRKLEEIGGLLGLDVGSVKSHLFRAVSKLREELRDLYGQSLQR